MADREKIINAINNCIVVPEKCNDCTWEECKHETQMVELPRKLIEKILELLKEQEAVKPMTGGLCGQCGCRIYQDANYCYNCGRKVKWDDH